MVAKVGNLAIMLIPCGMKFSREFYFGDCRFFCFAGTNLRAFGSHTLPQGTMFVDFLQISLWHLMQETNLE